MRLAGGSDPAQLRFSVLIGAHPNCSGDNAASALIWRKTSNTLNVKKTFFELADKWNPACIQAREARAAPPWQTPRPASSDRSQGLGKGIQILAKNPECESLQV
jgi:hypothetical protein